jgi:carbonic anhydrase
LPETRSPADLPLPPARRLAVVTCMDARLDPISILGLELGDAHVIRNAGGIVTEDVLRSLVVSHWVAGTEKVLVIGHTGCGMLTFDNRSLREQIARKAGCDASEMDFQPFTDPEVSVRESLRRVRESLLFRDGYSASGYLYDIHSGELHELAET